MSKTDSIHFFRRKVTVLRYLPQEVIWHKAEYRALPSRLPEWVDKVTLSNGCIRNDQLLLRQDLLQQVDQLPSDVLLLQGLHSAAWIELFQRAHALPFFLNLHRKENDIWVELKDDYYPHFGSKQRDRFDILPLPAGGSAAIHINARYWHKLFGQGTDTHYVENYLYLENLGEYRQATLVPDIEEPFLIQPQKEVDLRQMMY